MKKPRCFRPFHRRTSTARRRWLCLAVALITAGRQTRLLANPTGLNVAAGSASASQNGSQLNVTVGSAAFLNWSSFNIQAGETTTFLQPSSSSVVFNLIGDRSASQIYGSLNANGTVILANANGFYFGPNSFVKVGGSFIATTAPITPSFATGASWQFNGLPPLASIINYGQIQAGNGRSLYLIAENIENNGTLAAPHGSIGLYGGESVLVSDSADGRALSATVRVPSGSVDNLGRITADAGTIALQAQVVNQNGIIRADSVKDENGTIELVASDSLNLGANSRISARGDNTAAGSAGGTVTLQSGNTFSDSAGSQITTAGGTEGGGGGNIEVSAPNILSLNSAMDASARDGSPGGTFLLDPASIILGTSASLNGSAGNGTVAYNSGTGTLSLNVNTAFQNKSFSQITLQATGDITLNQNTAWNLSTSTGETTGSLTLEAGGNILFGSGAIIRDVNDWSVILDAGYSFTQNAVQSGKGSIFLGNATISTVNGQSVYTPGSGTGAILTAQGSVTLNAGNSILLGAGYVNTSAGGSITADALAGDINAGTLNAYGSGYNAPPIPPNHSGISTFAGGNVSLTAGDDIISIPTQNVETEPSGSSGTYGAGNVTLAAGNAVEGNFQVADGTGTILAGVAVRNGQVSQIFNPSASAGYVAADGSTKPLNLSLISGSWNVWAADYAYIGEVRNPNGSFGTSGLYNYAPDAALNLWAGDAITLDGSNLGAGRNGNVLAPVYPPVMNLTAGAGGITVNNSIILFPSAQGALQITTTDGGSLTGNGTATELTGITMSDGDPTDYTTFGLGHADTPVHANDPNPAVLNISGGISTFGLTVPTFADITVGGGTYNFGFLGQNVSAGQTTSITVAGSISYRGDLSSVSLADPLPGSLFNASASGLPEVTAKLRYDATTGELTFVGVMTQSELNFLLNPTVLELDQYGQPVLDANNNPVYVPLGLDATQTAAISQLFTASQSATLNDQGLGISGPGHFNISAGSIDLGISGGIFANAPDAPLAAVSPYGADINVTTAGDLDMTSTKIANDGFQGGINLNIGGALNVGDEDTTLGDASAPKGIFTESGGNVAILAQGDVNVNSSRIAAYNGGSITVESAGGDVNAGDGGTGHVNVDAIQLDPASGALVSLPTVGIPGSGILATTLPGSAAVLGNILVETPHGSITASQGGILQLSFDGIEAGAAIAELDAGYELQDSQGNRILAPDLTNPSLPGTLVLGNRHDPADTVFVNGQPLTFSAAAWPAVLKILGASPNPGQEIKITVPADQQSFITALDTAANGDPSGFSLAGFDASVSLTGNVDMTGSGIIAQNVQVSGTGEVQGFFVGFHKVGLVGGQIGQVTLFAPKVTETGPTLSDVGSSVIISDNPVDVNGVATAAQPPPPASVAKVVAAIAADAAAATGKSDDLGDSFGQDKKKGKTIGLAQKVSRVTVLLPAKNGT